MNSIAFGMRKALQSEQSKVEMQAKVTISTVQYSTVHIITAIIRDNERMGNRLKHWSKRSVT